MLKNYIPQDVWYTTLTPSTDLLLINVDYTTAQEHIYTYNI